jgi:hypothetical protein
MHLKVMRPSLVVAISLNHLYWTTRILLQVLQLISLQKEQQSESKLQKQKNQKTTVSMAAKNYQ